jgi:recombination protein RecA
MKRWSGIYGNINNKRMSQALRKLTASVSKNNCLMIFINQLREKVGVMFGNPETTAGKLF